MAETNTIYKKDIPAVKHKFKLSGSKVITYAILIFWAITTLLPLLWVVNNSFKKSDDILSSSINLAKKFDLNNYKTVLNYASIPKAFLNSFIISGSVVVLVCLIGGLAAFVISRFEFKFSKGIKMFLFISMLVPQFAVVVPNLVLLRKMHLGGSYLSIIIPHTASFLNFTILLLSSFMVSIPKELEESAIIDGCSIPKIFFKIIVPLSIPAFSTAAIVTFLWSYNDLLLSLVYISDRTKQPICVILALVSSVFGTNYGAMMAAIVVTILPILILYAFSQQYLIKGLTAGAVKG